MADLLHNEARIAAGFAAYLDSGAAFLEIQEKKQYLPQYRSWSHYLRARWHISAARARQLKLAYKLAQELIAEGVTIGNALPNERIMRELNGLEVQDAVKVLDMAQAALPEGDLLSTGHVKRAREYYDEIRATGCLELEDEAGELVQVPLSALTPRLMKEGLEAKLRQKAHMGEKSMSPETVVEWVTRKISDPIQWYEIGSMLQERARKLKGEVQSA